MSVKTDIKDLIEELDNRYPAFDIYNLCIYDSNDGELEGTIKIVQCDRSGKPFIDLFLLKTRHHIKSEPIDVQNLSDDAEWDKIRVVLQKAEQEILQ